MSSSGNHVMSDGTGAWQESPRLSSTSPWDQPLGKQALQTAQGVVVGLVVGGALFMAIALAMHAQMDSPAHEGMVISWVALLVAGLMLLARAAMPALVDRQALRAIRRGDWRPPRGRCEQERVAEFVETSGDDGRLALLFVQHRIIAAALVEGPTFFLLVAYLLEGTPIAMAAAATMLVLLATHLPTRAAAERWVEARRTELEEAQQWGP